MPIRSLWPLPGHEVPACGPLPSRVSYHRKPNNDNVLTHPFAKSFQPLAEETQPRCGVTLGSVTRPQGTLVPRLRPAPDGGKEGGANPRIAACSTVVSYWLRLFR